MTTEIQTTPITNKCAIVDSACEMQGDRQAVVVVEGDDFEVCGSGRVKTAVLQKANTMGLGQCGIDPAHGNTYRVDSNGNPVDPMQPDAPGAKFRRDYKVLSRQ